MFSLSTKKIIKYELTKSGMQGRANGMVWCGVVWCGMVWYGVVWCGMVWCGVVWCGVVWCGVVWYGTVRYVIYEIRGRVFHHISKHREVC